MENPWGMIMKQKFGFTVVNKVELALIQKMYQSAFKSIYQKYQDKETNPFLESLVSLREKWSRPNNHFYFFNHEDIHVGMIRIVISKDLQSARISPLLILPQFQGRGYAQQMLYGVETLYPRVSTWCLDTIAEESKLIHLYKKVGYVQDGGKSLLVKPGMNIIYFTKQVTG